MKNRILRGVIVAIILIIITIMPVRAIANPDSISFGTGTTPLYMVFENVLEDGDWFIVAEGYVYYAVEPTDYDADEAFIFEMLNTTGDETIISTTIKAYGDRPIGIYLSANQTDTLGLVSGTAYKLRIMGNPLIFASMTGNSVNTTLASGDYVDQLLGVDNGIATNNNLRNFLIDMVENIEAEDTPAAGYEYIVWVSGTRYLSTYGADIFLQGIPNLSNMCPILFQYTMETLESLPPDASGAYAASRTAVNAWGTTVANGLTNLGLYLGISQALAGSVVLFILAIALAVFVYMKTESGIASIVLVSATPFVGAYLGLMPMALAFIVVIIVAVLMGLYFFGKSTV